MSSAYKSLLWCFGIMAVVSFLAIGANVSAERPLSVWVIGVTLTVVVFALLRVFDEVKPCEPRWRVLKQTYHWRYQSWAYLSDSFTVVLALALAAAWYGDIQSAFFRSWLWVAISVMVGLGIAGLYHFKLDRPAYLAVGWGLALDSPTYLLHSRVIYPVLSSALVAYAVPFLFVHNRHTLVILVCVGAWLGFGIADGMRQKTKLNPKRLHRLYAKAICQPLGSAFELT